MKLNNKFLTINILTVFETFGLMILLLYGMQKITSMKNFQYRQARMQLHLTETINYINNINLYSVRIESVHDDWKKVSGDLEEDIKALTDKERISNLPGEFQSAIEYIPNLWRNMKFTLNHLNEELENLQSIPINDVENFYLVQYGIGGAKPFLVSEEHYQEIFDAWKPISDLMTNYRVSATQMSELNEKAVIELDELCTAETRNFAMVAIVIGIVLSIVLMVFVRLMTGRIAKRILILRDISGKLKEKDFTVDVDPNGSSEMMDLMNNMNNMVAELNDFLLVVKKTASKAISSGYQINDSANSTAAATTQIDANIESITKEFDQISLSVEQSVHIMAEMSHQVENLVHYNSRQTDAIADANQAVIEVANTLKDISEMASDRSRDAKEMNVLVADGDAKIKLSAKKLEEIKGQLKEIGGIVKIINDIASQTNLLSMNAAIESAHAGEAGKGFSVVAEEIRNLAENTAVNAKKIKEAINEIVSSVADANVAGSQASEAFGKVKINADQVVQSMEEISSGISKIDTQMGTIREKTEVTAQAANEINGYSNRLAESQRRVSDEVTSMNNRFTEAQNGIHEIKRGTSDIVFRINEVSENSKDSYKNMTDLENILDEFKTKENVDEAMAAEDEANAVEVSTEEIAQQAMSMAEEILIAGDHEEVEFNIEDVEEI